MLFISIYLPRFTRISNTRQESCITQEHELTLMLFREPEVVGRGSLYRTPEYRFYFSQGIHLEAGKSYRLFGKVADSLRCQKDYQIPLVVQSIQEVGKIENSPFYPLAYVLQSFARRSGEARREIRSLLSLRSSDSFEGLVFGRELSPGGNLTHAFERAGLSHLIVASGANIGLVATSLSLGSSRLLRRSWSMLLIISGVLFYAVSIGFTPPVLRALALFLYLQVARNLGRRQDAFQGLCFATLLLLVWNPLLSRSVSFTLSTAASIGIILAPQYLSISKERGSSVEKISAYIWNAVIASISVLIWILPILLAYFEEITFVGVLSTVIVAWLAEFLTIIGIIAYVLYLVSLPILGSILLWIFSMGNVFFIRLINIFSLIPVLHFHATPPSLRSVTLYYLLLTVATGAHLANRRSDR